MPSVEEQIWQCENAENSHMLTNEIAEDLLYSEPDHTSFGCVVIKFELDDELDT